MVRIKLWAVETARRIEKSCTLSSSTESSRKLDAGTQRNKTSLSLPLTHTADEQKPSLELP